MINTPDTTNFRDHLSAVSPKGKRIWIYPYTVKGKLINYRRYTAFALLGLLFSAPFIFINGRPLFLFNILERKFILFTVPFFPQDTFIFGLIMLLFLVGIVVFTVAFGRVFCGWVCPQTIFLEFIFRPIERFFEGSAEMQKKLAASKWNLDKVWRKTGKHIVFFTISFLIANIFLSYIIGAKEVYRIITEPVSEHLGGFIAMIVFSFAFYAVFAFVRELVCIWACPYGRLQGVLIDKNTMVVAYNFLRGEPRSKKSKAQLAGDCIDCNLCVKVCPTGIDIRNGTQLECINCTACIDACDQVMKKIGKPERLIGFNSLNGIEKQQKFTFNTRIISYISVLVILLAAVSIVLINRPQAELTLVRTPGQLFQLKGDSLVDNLYNFELVNKTYEDMEVKLSIEGHPEAKVELIGNRDLRVPRESMVQGALFIEFPKEKITPGKMKLKMVVTGNHKRVNRTRTTFFSPYY